MKKNIRKFLKTLPNLDEIAQEEFDRIIEVMGEDDVDERDLSLVYDYAKAFGDVIRIEAEVKVEGEVIESPKTGSPYLNPRASLLMNRREALAKLRRDLNLTPKARSEKTEKEKGKALTELLD